MRRLMVGLALWAILTMPAPAQGLDKPPNPKPTVDVTDKCASWQVAGVAHMPEIRDVPGVLSWGGGIFSAIIEYIKPAALR
jgi:hypothetical protein